MESYRSQWTRWKTECARVLYGNLPLWAVQKHLVYRYTSPAAEKSKYLAQWLWDSCFHAIVYRWFDEDMAWEELLSLTRYPVEAGHPDAGMIPHMQHLAAVGDTASQGLFRHRNRSNITQPPLIAIAALRVYQHIPHTAYLEVLYEANKRHHEWMERRRLDDDHLVAIIHPWEDWDAPQRWDDALGVSAMIESGANFAEIAQRLKAIRHDLMRRIAHYHGDAIKLCAAGSFYIKPVDFNAIRVADLRAMAAIAALLDKDDEARQFSRSAEQSVRAIQDKMVTRDNDRVFGHDLITINGEEQQSTVDSAAKFVLLFGQCVDEQDAALLRDEIAGRCGQYVTPYRVSTTPTDDLAFDPSEYWRGNVWMPVNWLIYIGLRQYGFVEVATTLAQNSLELVDKSGFCEFFNPITGEGGTALGVPAPQNQSWTTLVLDILGTELNIDSD